MAFRLIWLSCDILGAPFVAAPHVVDAAADWVIVQGDTPYMGQWGNRYGYNTVPVAASNTVQQMVDKHLQHWAKWGWKRLQDARRAGGPKILYQPDDHEWGGDNWDHTLAKANSGNAPIGATSQAQANQHWHVGVQAVMQMFETHYDNPSPGLAGNGDRPLGALADGNNPPAANYPVRYFIKDLDANGAEGGGHTRLVCVDTMSYRSPVGNADGPAKTMLGAVQAQWLIDAVVDAHQAGFRHILVLSPKKLFAAATNDNGDTWSAYANERDRILQAFATAGARPVWLSGDRHTPHVLESRSSSQQILDICACPVSTSLNGVGASPRIVWVGYCQVFGQVDVDDSGALLALRDAATGSPLWSCTVDAGSNMPRYPVTSVTPL